MKPICVRCERFMRPERNGYYFLEGMPIINGAEPGSWKPYKLWAGDLWRCPTCHYQTITGVPTHPIAEHYQPGFDELVERLGARRLLIKDR